MGLKRPAPTSTVLRSTPGITTLPHTCRRPGEGGRSAYRPKLWSEAMQHSCSGTAGAKLTLRGPPCENGLTHPCTDPFPPFSFLPRSPAVGPPYRPPPQAVPHAPDNARRSCLLGHTRNPCRREVCAAPADECVYDGVPVCVPYGIGVGARAAPGEGGARGPRGRGTRGPSCRAFRGQGCRPGGRSGGGWAAQKPAVRRQQWAAKRGRLSSGLATRGSPSPSAPP